MPVYRTRQRRRAAGALFSLLELAIVLAVLGVVATIVGPRMSRAAANANQTSRTAEHLLTGRLKALRRAIRDYCADHADRAPDAGLIGAQLTQFTDRQGHPSPVRTPRHCLGPYLREIPAIPVGSRTGLATVAASARSGAAWLYDPPNRHIRPNTSERECDTTGRLYSSY
ncbi:MAG TPA: type II secretion system protein [Tepidisphaeraceae bacterium]|jgi:prepilin-type N-terminal cleavage/methylation domain-containing protein